MPPPFVRAAVRDDLPSILDLLQQMSLNWDGTHRMRPPTEAERSAFEAIAADPGQQLLVVESDGEVVGTMSLVIVPALPNNGRPWAILENVVVAGDRRGQRLGELLVNHGVELARQANCYKVSLTSLKLRVDAHRFYQRLGFVATHQGFRIDFP